uniref:Sulfide:quinone oxidoreductase, mitochondrial n=1 Tax=Steinernema glaseri TaxID=37863 RepID=A0A1I7XZP7_9BILA
MKVSPVVLNAHYKLLVVGGGASGCAISHHFAKCLPKNQVAVLDPSTKHYYQPGFTLVGGGLMNFNSLVRQERDMIHPNSTWINEGVQQFRPELSKILTTSGEEITYDYLVIATGLQLRYDMVKGLPEALDTPGVCSIYHPKYAQKTFKELERFQSGNAIFTFPNTPIKCAGAPQKICYIAEDYFTKHGKREGATVMYNTTLGRIFGVEKYAKALTKIVETRNIQLNTRHNLVEVKPQEREAVFQLLDSEGKPTDNYKTYEYSLLHVGPPCSPIAPLREAVSTGLTDANGWVNVDPLSLQSVKYDNVFGIGDCLNTPNAKTAAAISSQFKALRKNLHSVMDGKGVVAQYDGYASCPLVVDSRHAILAEFNSAGPLETLPVDQAKPMVISYFMKRYLMPFLYWNFLVKGLWNGPATIRKILHLGMSK